MTRLLGGWVLTPPSELLPWIGTDVYQLNVEAQFAAAHQLRAYRGKCEQLHGHNWRVRLGVAGDRLDAIGLLVDFGDLKAWLNEVLERLDHVMLNEIEPFDKINPTSENLACYITEAMAGKLPAHIRVAEVTVWESDRCSATYRP